MTFPKTSYTFHIHLQSNLATKKSVFYHKLYVFYLIEIKIYRFNSFDLPVLKKKDQILRLSFSIDLYYMGIN